MIIASKYDGRCRKCGDRVRVGDKVVWQSTIKGVLCFTCAAISPFAAAQQPQSQSPTGSSSWNTQAQAAIQNAGSLNPNWGAPTPPYAAPKPPPSKPTLSALVLNALAAMEAVIIEVATKNITPEAEKQWEKYQKVKALALNAGTKGEEYSAMKQALVLAVKLAF